MKKLIWIIALFSLSAACASGKNTANVPMGTNGTWVAQMRAEAEAEARAQQAQAEATPAPQPVPEQPLSQPALAPPQPVPAPVAPTPPAPQPAFVPIPVAPQATAPWQFVPPGGVAPFVPVSGDKRIQIIGFTDTDPCRDNSYELAVRGAFSPRALEKREIIGRCAGIGSRHRYHVHIRVDDMPMKAAYLAGTVISAPVIRQDGKEMSIPLVPPGTRVWWLMPMGSHTIHVDMYGEPSTGSVRPYVKTMTVTGTFPYQNDPWGMTIKPDYGLAD